LLPAAYADAPVGPLPAQPLEINMHQSLVLGVVGGLLLSLTSLSGAADRPRALKHLTADEVSACVKQAVSARAGNIKKVEVKVDNNRTICEVHLEDAKGKDFETHVDVAAKTVLRVKD
jgi:hypothetical protein